MAAECLEIADTPVEGVRAGGSFKEPLRPAIGPVVLNSARLHCAHFEEERMRSMVVLFMAVLAGCASVRQQDLDAWKGMPVEALDTHSFFITVPMYRTITSSGIEIRNYANGRDVASCFTSAGARGGGNVVSGQAFTTCSSGRVVCNNIFYIKDGKVLEYVPSGRCMTDNSLQPEPRWRRLAH